MTASGKTRLSDIDEFPSEYREAARVIADGYRDSETPPELFFAEIDPTNGTLIFHLWHESAFTRENCNLVGNPGGLSRDVHFDIAEQQVTGTYFWQ